MHARFHIARQVLDGFPIPLRGPVRLCFEVRALPTERQAESRPMLAAKGETPLYSLKRPAIDPVSFVELTQISE